jgi:hypothetical protein
LRLLLRGCFRKVKPRTLQAILNESNVPFAC